MKFVFLDIDGVANSSRSVVVKVGPTLETCEKVRELARLDEADYYNGLAGNQDMRDPETALEYGVRFGLKTIDPVCVALINKLFAADPELGLVLSSTHRKFLCHSKVPFRSQEHLRRLRMYLDAMGFNVPEFFSATPISHGIRGKEIDEWLNMAYENGLYDDGEQYVILDDAADMLGHQPLVRVDPEHGFSYSNYAEACKLLGLKEPGVILL